jgi:hypothetical protein
VEAAVDDLITLAKTYPWTHRLMSSTPLSPCLMMNLPCLYPQQVEAAVDDLITLAKTSFV